MQTRFALVINTVGIMQMRLKNRLHVLHPITLLEAAKVVSLATHPTPRLTPSAPILAWSWASPRPERFSVSYYHVINNNTQDRILHYASC